MKLHILLDSQKEVGFDNDDIVLLSSVRQQSNITGRICYIDRNIILESTSVRNEILNLFDSFDEHYQNIANAAYSRLFQQLFTIMANVDRLLQGEIIDTIVLYEGAEIPFFSAKGGEGEGEKKNYTSNMMINAFLFNQYHNEYEIEWKYKKSCFSTFVKNYLRNRLEFLKLILTRVFLWLKNRNVKTLSLSNEITSISVISLILQKRHIDSILPYTKDEGKGHVYFSYNRQIVDYNKVLPIKELNILQLLNIILKVKKYRVATSLSVFGVSTSSLVREMIFMMAEYEILESRLRYTLDGYKLSGALMLSDTTVGKVMIASRNLARELSMRHVNIQHVTMMRILYPVLDLADEYYMYARRTYELYRQYSEHFKYYLPLINNEEKDIAKGDIIVFSVFMQPDSFSQEYIFYLNLVLPEIAKAEREIKVIIKPHYRQPDVEGLKRMLSIYPFVKVAEPDESVTEILTSTTIAMSINSSVIFETMMSRIPTIVYNQDDRYHDIVYNNDVCYPEVNFVIEDPLATMKILNNIEHYYDLFRDRLCRFSCNYSCETDLKTILGR